MVEPNSPRVKLPDASYRKPVVPGPNSWAKQQQQKPAIAPNGDAQPTNRDKYEHKPMPPPPAAEGCPPESHILQPKTYIQPAIPLVSSSSNPKNRAVTDPVAPKPLFAGRKVSVSQLRKKYSQSKDKSESAKSSKVDQVNDQAMGDAAPEKAAQILGLYPVPDNSRNTPPSSAPTAQVPDIFRSSEDDSEGRSTIPARQVQSSPVPTHRTPIPTRRYLRENGLPDPTASEASNIQEQQNVEPVQQSAAESNINHEHKVGNGFLHPARIGTHSNIGEVGLVESGMHRVESFRGVIEDAPPPISGHDQIYTSSSRNSSEPNSGQARYPEAYVSHDLYSPSNYGGVWENDPAVVSIFQSLSNLKHWLNS